MTEQRGGFDFDSIKRKARITILFLLGASPFIFLAYYSITHPQSNKQDILPEGTFFPPNTQEYPNLNILTLDAQNANQGNALNNTSDYYYDYNSRTYIQRWSDPENLGGQCVKLGKFTTDNWQDVFRGAEALGNDPGVYNETTGPISIVVYYPNSTEIIGEFTTANFPDWDKYHYVPTDTVLCNRGTIYNSYNSETQTPSPTYFQTVTASFTMMPITTPSQPTLTPSFTPMP